MPPAIQGLAGVKKVIVAVHGMGDQFQADTVQAVYKAFARHYQYRPAVLPLGRFHSAGNQIEVFRLRVPPDPHCDHLKDIGFVEVYWADIPRKLQVAGYVIQESKAWARTVVERTRARAWEVRALAAARELGQGQGQGKVGGIDAQIAQMRETDVLSLIAQVNNARAKSMVLPPPGKGAVPPPLNDDNLLAAADVVEELIETIQVLDRLLYLADKAGLLHFSLDDLLTAFLGDVQVVAEFADQRAAILTQFDKVLRDVHQSNPDAEIHVIAHSEGTVVSFYGLVNALAGLVPGPGLGLNVPGPLERPAWVEQVRGYMTFGSPIDKHLVLWPEMWPDLAPGQQDIAAPTKTGQIQWFNYYDYGDPVGFELDTARTWLNEHLPGCFHFPEAQDCGFGRYLLPGWAHVAYWTDAEVFGHFIDSVVSVKPGKIPPPASRAWQEFGARVLPYMLVALLHVAAVYVLWRTLAPFLVPPHSRLISLVVPPPAGYSSPVPLAGVVTPPAEPGASDGGNVVENVLGISALILGITAGGRILWLTRSPKMGLLAWVLFAVGSAVYAGSVETAVRFRLGLGDWLPAAPLTDGRVFWTTALVIAAGVLTLLLQQLSRNLPTRKRPA